MSSPNQSNQGFETLGGVLLFIFFAMSTILLIYRPWESWEVDLSAESQVDKTATSDDEQGFKALAPNLVKPLQGLKQEGKAKIKEFIPADVLINNSKISGKAIADGLSVAKNFDAPVASEKPFSELSNTLTIKPKLPETEKLLPIAKATPAQPLPAENKDTIDSNTVKNEALTIKALPHPEPQSTPKSAQVKALSSIASQVVQSMPAAAGMNKPLSHAAPPPLPPLSTEPTPTLLPRVLYRERIDFNVAGSELPSAAKTRLAQIAELLKLEVRKLRIVGHTDNTGNPANNQTLSLQRAQAVKDYLVQAGITRDYLSVEGRGGSEPLEDNSSAEGQRNNRRIEIIE